MIVDDTVTYRRILTEVVEGIPEAVMVGTAPNGTIAMKKLDQLKPDLVLLDIEMPEMDGLETLAQIKKQYRHIEVILISGVNSKSADRTIKGLELGALDFLAKPEKMGYEESIRHLRQMISSLIKLQLTRRFTQMARQPQPTPATRPAPPPPPAPEPAAPSRLVLPPPKRIDLVAIGSSTGGPEALSKVLPLLPGNFPLPILIVQHMPPVFTASLAANLNKRSALTIKEAEDGETIEAGTVYIAPGGRHMVMRPPQDGGPATIGINEAPPVKSCRPSVDVLFRSIAAVQGGNVLAVVLTGMGDDGSDGVAALKRKGCYCITQSETSCVVYGMPRAVDEANNSDERVDIENIAARIITKTTVKI